jgi:signal transduction histidine kinase
MVAHNLFFLALAVAVYLAVLPPLEMRLGQTAARESALVEQVLRQAAPGGGEAALRGYDLRSGSADDFGLPPEAKEWLRTNPGEIWRNSEGGVHLYRAVPDSARLYRVTLPAEFHASTVQSARWGAGVVLAATYALGVLVLELFLMPRFIYQPLRLLQAADQATRAGDRTAEIVPEAYIPGDEIGTILRSRNQTVAELRRHEDGLESALAELKRKNEMLEAQDRLASLGLLSAGVAHELNTPLAVLEGSLEKLLEGTTDAGQRARLERAGRMTVRLRQISEGLLDFARRRPEKTGPVEVRSLVEEAWEMAAIDKKAAGVSVSIDVPAGLRVSGDAGRLGQVFINLLRNAVLAAPAAGGAVWVRARRVGDHVRIAVEDNGSGIPPEVLPDVFEAFVSTRLDAQGTGLGLAVAEGIVERHGGRISAANRPEGGARLEVVLPVSKEDAR